MIGTKLKCQDVAIRLIQSISIWPRIQFDFFGIDRLAFEIHFEFFLAIDSVCLERVLINW